MPVIVRPPCVSGDWKIVSKVESGSGGTNWTYEWGASAILQSSRFSSNRGVLNNAGVVMMNDYTNVTVVGQENVFENNTCAQGGAVFGADTFSLVTVEGGTFVDNAADVKARSWPEHGQQTLQCYPTSSCIDIPYTFIEKVTIATQI